MSYTTMYVVGSDLKITPLKEFRNAWGSAAAVWSLLSGKYLRDESAWLTGFGGNCKPLWELWKDDRLSHDERVALLFTFDYAVIGYPSRLEAAKALRVFAPKIDPACVNHLPEIAAELEQLPECFGVCFHQTSVSESPWFTWDDEKEESIPYDFTTGAKHFDVMGSARKVEQHSLA